MPPNILYPNIPAYPGVPSLLRPVNAAIAQVPELAVALGSITTVLGAAIQQSSVWGIFNQDGTRLGLQSSSSGLLQSIAETALLGNAQTTLSTFGFDFVKEARVSNFPVEDGSFAAYNKVQMPANPVVTLILDGDIADRYYFLQALNDACNSTDLFNVVTPERTFIDYALERFNYRRRARNGVNLLIVDVSMIEVRQVSVSYAQVTPISNPQNAGATPAVDSGKVQAVTPPSSSLLYKTMTTKFPSLFGGGS